MAFSIVLNGPLDPIIREAGVKQLRKARKALQSAGTAAQDIHDARRALKRFRALLHLTAPAMADGDFQRFDRGASAAAKVFAATRDVHVMMETATRLAALDGEAAPPPLVAALKSRLRMKREQAETNLHDRSAREAVARLETLARQFGKVKLGIKGFATLADGYARVCGKAREAMERARETGADGDHHRWRKSVQRHWRHLQFLEPVWPAMLQPQINLAHELADTLGEDNDLATLKALVEREQALIGRDAPIEPFTALCRREQDRLRECAYRLGRRLFAEKPKAARRRLRAYWETAEPPVETEAEPASAQARSKTPAKTQKALAKPRVPRKRTTRPDKPARLRIVR